MQEIFSHFEVNRDPRWPILLRLITLSLVFHGAALASVLYIPGVRESFNIAALMSGMNYVDRAYTKTEIGEEVRVVDVAQKFRYPDGYFATEQAVEQAAPPASIFPDPWAPTSAQPEVVATPDPSPSPEASPEPSPSASPMESPVVAIASPSASPEDEEAVEQELNRIAEANSVVRPNENEVNTRPLKDWLARANQMKEKGELDLTTRVDITIAANLTSTCKLAEAKVVQKSGDARLLDVAKDLVSAIGDSGMLSFLRDPKKVQDPNKVECDEIPLQLNIRLDQNEIAALVESRADTPARAAEMANGYNGLLAIGQLLKRGRDEEMLYKSTKITAEDKRILVNFSMPRQTAGEMLKKQLPDGRAGI
ncbi:MAG TPA: hypothetical protein VJ023_06565 [Pyrinomonadaceae bacterium]|nr:hypothetical protein [Pyrinomonadaceae bacterium]